MTMLSLRLEFIRRRTAARCHLAAVISRGPAVVDVPERVAAIAEQARAGNHG